MPAPLLVLTDLSDASTEALALALRLARGTGAPVHLLHVIPWPDAGPFEVPGEAPTAAQESGEERDLARAALSAQVAEAGGAAADVTVAAQHGAVPAAVAAEVARSIGAGLIVAGRCGRRPRGQTLGGVAAELAQTAPCDVLLVPGPAERPTSEAGRVLVAVDFSGASAEVVRTGLATAAALGGVGVDVVHVLEPMPHPVRWMDEALLDLLPGIRERAEAALQALVAEAVPDGSAGEVRLFVERGKAARTVARTAEALGASVVVTGPHAERPVLDGLLGSVAEGVARRFAGPVLIARHAVPVAAPV